LPADCTSESVVEAVAREVDGGIESDLLACNGAWMSVDTYTNACSAGEPFEERCVGNHHVVYFRNVDGIWRVGGFDDCEAIRAQYPDLPTDICRPAP
jgi:hypothetical protein